MNHYVVRTIFLDWYKDDMNDKPHIVRFEEYHTGLLTEALNYLSYEKAQAKRDAALYELDDDLTSTLIKGYERNDYVPDTQDYTID